MSVIDTDIREYGEKYKVKIIERKGRQVIVALNSGGYDSTLVDLGDVVDWVKANAPELLK